MGCPVLTAQIAGLVWREYRAWLPCSTLNPTREATLLHGYSKHRILNLKSWHKPRCTSLGQVSSYNLTILSDSPVARSFSRCLSFFFFCKCYIFHVRTCVWISFSVFQREGEKKPVLPFEEVDEEVDRGLSSYLIRGKSSLFFQRQQLPRLLPLLPQWAASCLRSPPSGLLGQY